MRVAQTTQYNVDIIEKPGKKFIEFLRNTIMWSPVIIVRVK